MDGSSLRVQSGKLPLKEKFVAVCEAVLRGEDPSGGRGEAFWDEALLLKVNGVWLAKHVGAASEETLVKNGASNLRLLGACARVIEAKDAMRAANGLAIVAVFLRAVFRKKFSNFGFDVLNLVGGGFESGDLWFRALVGGVLAIVADEARSLEEHAAAVELVLSLASGCENVAANSLIEYLHREEAFDALMSAHLHRHPETMFKAVLATVLIANYQKYETRNIFVGKLVALSDPGSQSLLAKLLTDLLRQCRSSMPAVGATSLPSPAKSASSSGGGWFSSAPSSLASSSSSIPSVSTTTTTSVGGTGVLSVEQTRYCLGGTLLAVYELSYLSKEFFMRALLSAHGVCWGDKQLAKNMLSPGPDLLRELVETASLLCLSVKDERSALHCKMALLSFVPWLEDSSVLELLHGTKLCWSEPLKLARKTENTAIVGNLSDSDIPPICWILDMLLEFVKNNVHTSLQIRLHTLVMSLFHRVLCFQKAQHLCLKRFKWDALWKQMFRLLGFVAKDEYFKKPEVLELAQMIFTIFNLFITYGDTFLPSGNDYDYLYYELIREAKTLTQVQVLVDKFSTDSLLALHMENISAIVAHFKVRIDQWVKANDGAGINPDDVLAVIKRNYGSLKLTLLDNLDVYQPYMENPTQVSFFRQYIRGLVTDTRACL